MNFKKLTVIKAKKIDFKSIKFSKKTKRWCQLPYPDHKKGCPNYNNRSTCPPNSPNGFELIKNFNKFYLIWAEFDFKTYLEQRSKEHPEWTEKKTKCVLYWQSSIKKILKEKVALFLKDGDYLLSCGSGFGNEVYSMESVGIDVFSTLKNNDIDFEIFPKNVINLVCLICKERG